MKITSVQLDMVLAERFGKLHVPEQKLSVFRKDCFYKVSSSELLVKKCVDKLNVLRTNNGLSHQKITLLPRRRGSAIYNFPKTALLGFREELGSSTFICTYDTI